jgi:hypothetical protein
MWQCGGHFPPAVAGDGKISEAEILSQCRLCCCCAYSRQKAENILVQRPFFWP